MNEAPAAKGIISLFAFVFVSFTLSFVLVLSLSLSDCPIAGGSQNFSAGVLLYVI
jgi:hypothetical protein